MTSSLFLYIFAFIAFISALSMLFLRHPMRVAMALITVMLSLAAIFATLNNHVLAIFQVLIYVGAIMVFMVYVIMLLDPRDQSLLRRFSTYAIPGSLLLVLSLIFLAPKFLLPDNTLAANPITLTINSFSREFINDYFLYFELTSVLLMVAVVCAITIIKGKPHDF